MKINLLLVSLFISYICAAQPYNGPESVVYDGANNRYFISNNGANQILARDASGALSIFTSNIASGPHGLEIVGNTLYACDGSSMKGFDLTTAAQVMNLNVGASFLNGICTDGSAYLYATDFTAKKIFKIDIAAQAYTTFVTGLVKSPNGIIYDGANNRLIWVTWGSSAPVMQALLSDSTVSQVTATTLGNCDGIVRDGSGNYYVSAWNTQSVYRFDNMFSAAPVAVITGLSNPADIYYNLADDSLVSPNSGNSTVTFHYMGASTGVDEVGKGDELNIFPNPVVDEFKIYNLPAIAQGSQHWQVGVRFTISEIDICNALGEKVFEQRLTPNVQRLTISVADFPSGIYFVRVVTEKTISTCKFVKE